VPSFWEVAVLLELATTVVSSLLVVVSLVLSCGLGLAGESPMVAGYGEEGPVGWYAL